ncbi:hypothetical protein RRG08_018514 [Elysia crispata]|uniref:Uncharacterized protein n=1 Tax=Elysia crispata TaxID=231223 RepID=A0AAE1DXJ0_9GAST|nr:hypothetical protein RRG08_018514 [Elysia crispata]
MITGGFNRCNTSRALPGFQQYVTCATREKATLDLYYANVTDACTSYSVCPLSKSSHCLILLKAKYRSLVQRIQTEMENAGYYHVHTKQEPISKPLWILQTGLCLSTVHRMRANLTTAF